MQIPTRYISYDCVYMYIVASSCGGNLSIDLLSVSRSRAFVSSSYRYQLNQLRLSSGTFADRLLELSELSVSLVSSVGGWGTLFVCTRVYLASCSLVAFNYFKW